MWRHSKNWRSPRSAPAIFSEAAVLDGRPSGWSGGEKRAGRSPIICSRVQRNMRSAASLQSEEAAVEHEEDAVADAVVQGARGRFLFQLRGGHILVRGDVAYDGQQTRIVASRVEQGLGEPLLPDDRAVAAQHAHFQLEIPALGEGLVAGPPEKVSLAVVGMDERDSKASSRVKYSLPRDLTLGEQRV